jgi:hypothetical protein
LAALGAAISCSSNDDDKSLDSAGGSGGSSASGASGGTGGTIALTGGTAGMTSSSGGMTGTTGGTDGTTGGSSSGGTEGGAAGDNGGVGKCDLSALGSCGTESVEAVLRTVNMLLVIDKSGSMTDPLSADDSKWTAMKSALGSALENVKSEMNFGLVLYPYSPFHVIPEVNCDDTCCDVELGSAAVNVPITPGTISAPEIARQLDDTAPGGGTPTAAALDSALDYFVNGDGASLPGNNYVLLATDGGPNCNGDLSCEADTCTTNLDGSCPSGNCCKYENTRNQCLDDGSVLAKLEALTAAGVSTFVVGLPGTQQYADYLNQFAIAGGVPSTSGDTSYYAVSEAQGVDGLLSVFDEITTQLVRSCDIPLSDAPSQPDLVNVAVDCDVVPQENDDGSGWDFDEPSAPTAVVLHGPVCDRLQQNGAKRIDVVFGCPTVR